MDTRQGRPGAAGVCGWDQAAVGSYGPARNRLRTGRSGEYHPSRFQDPDSGAVVEIHWVESLRGQTPHDTSGHPSTATVTATARQGDRATGGEA